MQTYNFSKLRKEVEVKLKGIKQNISKIEYKEMNPIINNYYEKIIRNEEFKYNYFKENNFENIQFYNCSFVGSKFLKSKFKDVIFVNCSFYNKEYEISIFDNKTTFINCQFKNCNMEKSIFENIKLYDVTFIKSSLKESIFNNTYINNIKIIDCDCRTLKIINSNIMILDFEDNYLTKFDEDTFIDKIKLDKKCKKNYELAFKLYKGISSKFEDNRLHNNAGEYYYIAKCMEYKNLKGINKIKSAISWTLCGYGERPTFALITSLEIILIFAIMYMITGLSLGSYVISYKDIFFNNFPLQNLNSDFFNCIYFSIVTFTTVGYGDITPIGISVLLSGIEMLLGVTMVGIWTATLARKITR